MNYLKSRLTQVTTWCGFAMAGFALYSNGGHLDGEIVSVLLGALGLVHVNDGNKE